jgi:aspartate 1-decarboxylase
VFGCRSSRTLVVFSPSSLFGVFLAGSTDDKLSGQGRSRRPGQIKVVAAKLHGIVVTDANLEYRGSITLDPEHCAIAGIYPLEFVDIWNLNNGNRISTYVILGDRGSDCCILNGAAARTCQRGDKLIICASTQCTSEELYKLKPRVLFFGPGNRVSNVIEYQAIEGIEFDELKVIGS